MKEFKKILHHIHMYVYTHTHVTICILAVPTMLCVMHKVITRRGMFPVLTEVLIINQLELSYVLGRRRRECNLIELSLLHSPEF